MALKIIDKKIVGTIDNLEEKLSGEIPVTREDLLVLVSSWGRVGKFYTFYQNATSNPLLVKNSSDNQILIIDKCEAKECYDLSKLDTSEITNMESIFKNSEFNGDISNWNTNNATDMRFMFSGVSIFDKPLNFNTSNVTNMDSMFYNASSFNQAINFNTSKVTGMNYMFYEAKSFNQPIKFDTSKVIDMESMFSYAKAFQNKYNNSETLSIFTNEIKEWLNNNRDRMNNLYIKDKYGEQIDDFFSNFSNKEFSKEI